MGEFRLSERQRLFAEENHSILVDFLDFMGLPLDEYYDVVIFGFLNAVRKYDEREDLKQYKFESIARNQMRTALDRHFQKLRKRDEFVHILSLDYEISPNLTFGDTIASDIDVCEYVCEKLSRAEEGSELLHTTPKRATLDLREVVAV